jgi:integrase
VIQDRGFWRLQLREGKTRRTVTLGSVTELKTKSDAERAADEFRRGEDQNGNVQPAPTSTITVRVLADQFRRERMEGRPETRRSYEHWLRAYIVPKWGDKRITQLQPRALEVWLRGLSLSPKSLSHIRSLLSQLYDYAMFAGYVEVGRNPIELIRLRGVNNPLTQKTVITPEQFRTFVRALRGDPFTAIAEVCGCLGLRFSEATALRWSDYDPHQHTIAIRRSIVRGNIADTKTESSRKVLPVGPELCAVLDAWRQRTEFAAPDDWVFASPSKIGREPWAYPTVLREFGEASKRAGVPHLSPHCLRHSYRAWLSELGAGLEVQHRLMRHSTIGMTLKYGQNAAPSPELSATNAMVSGMVLGNASQERLTPSTTH